MRGDTIITVSSGIADSGQMSCGTLTCTSNKKHDIALPDEQKCPKCKQGFGQIGKYKAHIITCETDTHPFVCNICDETFWQRPTYTHHMRQKHKQPGVPAEKHFFFCTLCGKKLCTLSGKKSHEHYLMTKMGTL